jgi:2-polyprenyl-3-methyl-5-hydroxy-6-metoxy-1,4-benzoquinol methylase
MSEKPMPLIRGNCCVCGSNETSNLFKPLESPGPVVKCKRCGFIYVNPIETTKALIQEGPVLGGRADFLLTSSNINDIHGSWEQEIIDKYLQELPMKITNAKGALEHLNKFISNPGTLLDIGCFCGVFLNTAKQAGWKCYGIEPLVMPAIYARGYFNLNVTTDTLRESIYPPAFFDVVTSFQVFEHLINPDQEIRLIRNLLKPGGLLMIEVPNIDTVMVKLLGKKHRHFVQDHVSFFSAKTLSQLLEQLGFEVRKVYYPARVMSLNHLVSWLRKQNHFKYADMKSSTVNKILERSIRLNIGDIVSVIASKK